MLSRWSIIFVISLCNFAYSSFLNTRKFTFLNVTVSWNWSSFAMINFYFIASIIYNSTSSFLIFNLSATWWYPTFFTPENNLGIASTFIFFIRSSAFNPYFSNFFTSSKLMFSNYPFRNTSSKGYMEFFCKIVCFNREIESSDIIPFFIMIAMSRFVSSSLHMASVVNFKHLIT